jgi:beta-glucosidase
VQYRERHLVGYRFHDTAQVPARFPFGHGLGYTTWQVDDVRLTGAGTDRTVHARLTNTGSRPGSQVLQVYVGREGASAVARPAKELRGFARVHLDAGASTEVTIELDRRCFTVWDVATKAWVVEAGTYAVLVGTSSTQLTARLPVVLESDDVLATEPPVADLVANDAEFTALLGHPVPPPAPVRPFTRTTTIGELAASRAGRGLAALMQAGITRRVSGGEAIDDRMLTAVVQGMPLRAFVQMAGGALTFGHLDRVLAALNGDVRGLLRRGDRPGERDGAALR